MIFNDSETSLKPTNIGCRLVGHRNDGRIKTQQPISEISESVESNTDIPQIVAPDTANHRVVGSASDSWNTIRTILKSRNPILTPSNTKIQHVELTFYVDIATMYAFSSGDLASSLFSLLARKLVVSISLLTRCQISVSTIITIIHPDRPFRQRISRGNRNRKMTFRAIIPNFRNPMIYNICSGAGGDSR